MERLDKVANSACQGGDILNFNGLHSLRLRLLAITFGSRNIHVGSSEFNLVESETIFWLIQRLLQVCLASGWWVLVTIHIDGSSNTDVPNLGCASPSTLALRL